MDQNRDGKISESEFLSACSTISEDHLLKAFKALNMANDGFIVHQFLNHAGPARHTPLAPSKTLENKPWWASGGLIIVISAHESVRS